MTFIRSLALVSALLGAFFLCACSKPSAPVDKTEGGEHEHAHHEHRPPHGGTAVVLGDELYHLEIVFDPSSGRLQAYVLDGELENFVRCPAASLTLRVFAGSGSQSLQLAPVANVATGEAVGNTALFEGQADWMINRAHFDAELEEIVIRGTRFSGVKFNYPKGNEND